MAKDYLRARKCDPDRLNALMRRLASPHMYVVRECGPEGEVGTYRVTSMRQLALVLNQGYDYVRKDRPGLYSTIRGERVTTHSVTRIY